jgi:hypothetical protein
MAKEVFEMLPFLLKHLPNREYARYETALTQIYSCLALPKVFEW